MYTSPTNSVEYKFTYDESQSTQDTARGTDCTVRFRDIFGVEHMIDYSDKNKTHRDPITIWVPIEPLLRGY